MILGDNIDSDFIPKWYEIATPFWTASEEELVQYKLLETPPLSPRPSIACALCNVVECK